MSPFFKKYFILFFFILTLTGLSGCAKRHLDEAEAPIAPEPEAHLQAIPLLSGAIFNLTAGPVQKSIDGANYSMLGYNGQIPGPLLKVHQNDEITIQFKNDLEEPALLHPHGVRADNASDGTHLTQNPVQPGEIFTQKLRFPDPGLYWYHPHLREDKQQDLGLYGAILVEPEDPAYWNTVDREEVVIVDDAEVVDGTLPDYGKLASHTLMGRFGNTLLINGTTDYRLSVNQGETIRFYFLNAANTRPFNLKIPGIDLKLVGGDNGRVEQEEWRESILLAPSERAVVEVNFDQQGIWDYSLIHETPDKTSIIGRIEVAETTTLPSANPADKALRSNAEWKTLRAELSGTLAAEPAKTLRLGVKLQGMMMNQNHAMNGGNQMPCHAMPDHGMMGQGDCEKGSSIPSSPTPIEWEDSMAMMNAMSTKENVQWQLVDEGTAEINDRIVWNFKPGEQVKIRIFNDPESMHPMQHPIHFHGQRFVVLAEDGKTNPNLMWKDTVLLKTGSTVDLLVEMNNPGKWMAHCHIAEHLEGGMMIKFNVNFN